MESALQGLVNALKLTRLQLNGDLKDSLNSSLHDTNKLPDKQLSTLVVESLDLLSEVRLLLEPGQLILADHFFGYMNTKALCAAVELNIPNLLRSGPVTLPELANLCHGRPDRLRQVMRTLHNNGIFTYDQDCDAYSNNSTSTLLLSDHWTQWHNWVQLYGNQFYDMACGIPGACREDATRCPSQIKYNTDDGMLKYFIHQGWITKFQQTLSGGAIAQAPGIVQDYPWDEVGESTIVDIGGGAGGMIAGLLRQFPTIKGAILETPRVIEQARANFQTGGEYAEVQGQIPPQNLISGDFLKSVTPSEVYTMKWCLHDWDDDKARVILNNIRKAIVKSSKSRLVILESVLSDGYMGKISRYGDMNMFVAVGGGERDERQWRALAVETGWELTRIYPLRNAWPCAIEFVPNWIMPYPWKKY